MTQPRLSNDHGILSVVLPYFAHEKYVEWDVEVGTSSKGWQLVVPDVFSSLALLRVLEVVGQAQTLGARP